jgi:hypothetical protein
MPERKIMLHAQATINWEDGKLRLYTVQRLDKEDFQAIRAQGFNYVRGDTIYFASYTPQRAKFLLEHFELESLDEDDTNLNEIAENRAERFQQFSDNADKRAQAAHKAEHAILDNIPMGQPILVGHHSEGRHRRDLERAERHIRKAIEEGDKANYWQRRAEAALKRVERRETPRAIYNRIERLEADLRKFQRDIVGTEGATFEHYQAWIWFTENRLSFERALIEALPQEAKPINANEIKLEKGGVFFDERQWYVIEKVNQKTVNYTTFGLRLKHPVGAITAKNYLSPAQLQEALNEGRLKPAPHGGGFVNS